MEYLFTRNPMLRSFSYKEVGDFRTTLLNTASKFNIATGFVSSDSLVELKRLVKIRDGSLSVDLFIGMNYLEGFTELQYNILSDLNDYLICNNAGKVYVCPRALFHGKMYSFNNSNGECMGGFIGSSNLGSFMGTAQNNLEADLFLPENEGCSIDNYIKCIISDLGTEFSLAEPITSFLPPETDLLKGVEHVKHLSEEEFIAGMSTLTDITVEIPLKTEPKSNLNTYFGAGKVKNRYSPRSWYEVELIIPQKTPNRDLLPTHEQGPFRVVTPNHYSFFCERQGDYDKNFRSCKDLRILGKWIKGEMENKGVIRCGQMVTPDTINAFGKSKLVLTKSTEDFWYLSLQ
jgi:hypothetical protein